MNAIYILWLRELKKYTRSRAQIVASLGQPLLYLLVLGFGLGPVFQKAGNGSYLQFVAPGVISMTILFTAIFSGIAMLWDRQFGFLKETLVAPVPRIEVMIGRTLGGATVAVIQGTRILAVCLVAGFRPARLSLFPLAIITRLDPLTYGVDALRVVLINASHFGLALDVSLLCAIAVAFLSLGGYLFSRIQL